MIKDINMPPYTKAEIKEVFEDGTALCDIYGDRVADTDIIPDAGYLRLSPEDVAEFTAERIEAAEWEE